MWQTSDERLARVGTRFALFVAPMGVPVVIEAPNGEMRALVRQACRDWEGDIDPHARTLHLTMLPLERVNPGLTHDIQVDGTGISVTAPGIEGSACAASGAGWCRVMDPLAADPLRLREEVLDPLLLFLITRNDRVPIHASAFFVGELAVLLVGPSGTGKSCLALAARRAGLSILSDDIAYVQLDPVLRVWGMTQRIHVFAQDLPEGAASRPRVRNGKLKYGIPVADGQSAHVAERAAVCLLTPGEKVAIDIIAPRQATFMHELEPGFDLLARPIAAAFERLTVKGALRLTLSRDPDEAIMCLLRHRSLLSAVCS